MGIFGKFKEINNNKTAINRVRDIAKREIKKNILYFNFTKEELFEE